MAEKPVAPKVVKKNAPAVDVEHKESGKTFKVSAKYFDDNKGSLKKRA